MANNHSLFPSHKHSHFYNINIVIYRSLRIICLTDYCNNKGLQKWDNLSNYQTENAVHTQKRVSCSKSAIGVLPCSHQADIRMRSHRLLRLDDNKSAASCQQAWYKLIVKTFYPQAWCKLFQQLTSNKSKSSSFVPAYSTCFVNSGRCSQSDNWYVLSRGKPRHCCTSRLKPLSLRCPKLLNDCVVLSTLILIAGISNSYTTEDHKLKKDFVTFWEICDY